MPDAVAVERLCKSYGSVHAVRDMSWSAPTECVTAVLGPNGAGKTTTMECLEGLIEPTSGHCSVLGTTPWGADAEHRARVGVMLQDGGMPNSIKPIPLLRHLASLYAAPQPVDALVERLGINEFSSRSIRRLSGGQRQRVALASALIGNPDVVFLDEPTAGLDPHARLDAWELIRETRDSGVAVVVTTHSFEEAERLADRIIIVNAGAIAASGTLDELQQMGDLEALYFSLTRKADR